MAGLPERENYRPVYVIQIFLDSGTLTYSTREVEVSSEGEGFGEGSLGEGPFD